MHIDIKLLLLGGFGEDDRRLMIEKITYLSAVGHHANIVRFVGSYDDPDGG